MTCEGCNWCDHCDTSKYHWDGPSVCSVVWCNTPGHSSFNYQIDIFQWITLAFEMWERMTEISVPNLHFTKFLIKNTIVIALQIIAPHWILSGLWGLRKNWTYQLSCFIARKSSWFKYLHHSILLIPLLYCASQYKLLWQDLRWAESLSCSRLLVLR